MSTVAITPELVVEAGLPPTFYEDDGSPGATHILNTTDTFKVANAGRLMLVAHKEQASACDLVIPTPVTYRGKAVADLTITIPDDSSIVVAGPFDRALYNNDDGTLQFTLSDTTGLFLAAVRLP